jgi:hypothetical protein
VSSGLSALIGVMIGPTHLFIGLLLGCSSAEPLSPSTTRCARTPHADAYPSPLPPGNSHDSLQVSNRVGAQEMGDARNPQTVDTMRYQE